MTTTNKPIPKAAYARTNIRNTDESFSGKRPKFEQLLSDIKNSAIEYTVVYQFSSLGRNQTINKLVNHEVSREGIEVISLSESLINKRYGSYQSSDWDDIPTLKTLNALFGGHDE
jgi:DNA invertase Pin-like site-specific DNA recombinase